VSAFAPVTEAQLAQARSDPAFRQRLLEQSLEVLLAGLQKLRAAPSQGSASAKPMREAVQIPVRLAELIQGLQSDRACVPDRQLLIRLPFRASCVYVRLPLDPGRGLNGRPRQRMFRKMVTGFPMRNMRHETAR